MKNKQTVLAFILMTVAVVAYSQQYDPERDFRVIPEDDKKSIIIYQYLGSKQTVNIPPTIQGLPVTSIYDRAFKDRTSITNIIIPNSVTTIRLRAFEGCTSLKTVTIPNSVTSIYDRIFSGCISLTSINVDAGNTKFCSDQGVFYNKDKTYLYVYPARKTDSSFTIPDSVTRITNEAFAGCTSLTSITIPDSVTDIGSSAFQGCTKLTSITIPNGVSRIWEEIFKGCTNLTSITFQGVITSENFSDKDSFPGDLRTKYFAEDIVKRAGTYSRPNGSSQSWTRITTPSGNIVQTRITGKPFVTFGQAPQLIGGRWVSVFPIGDTGYWSIRELTFKVNEKEGIDYYHVFQAPWLLTGHESYGSISFNTPYEFLDTDSKDFPNSSVKSDIHTVGSYIEGDKYVFLMENGGTTTFVREKINLAGTKWKIANSAGNVYVIYSFMENGTYRLDISHPPAWLKNENITGTYSVIDNFVTLKPNGGKFVTFLPGIDDEPIHEYGSNSGKDGYQGVIVNDILILKWKTFWVYGNFYPGYKKIQ